MAHRAKASIRIRPLWATANRTARGNGDNIFKAMALTNPAEFPEVAKANKLDVAPMEKFPNPGRYVMTIANRLRGRAKRGPVIVGKYALSGATAPNEGLDLDWSAAIARTKATT